jgi:hypothetical protein
MKIFFSLFILLQFLTSFVQAQSGTIKGNLRDGQNRPIPYSNVAVYQSSDSSLVTGSITDAEGNFLLKLNYGQYFLKVSAIGFTTYLSKSMTINELNPMEEFPSIMLEEDVQVMEAVEVRALRPQIEMQADKMVVSVEGTAMAAGTSAYEVLEKSPGVFVDQDGNIQLNGKGGVLIMIDDRRTYLSAADLQNMLQGMSADNIKNIEIINNPSSRYDAEGDAGIINITLKKNTMSGVNGSVNLAYRYNEINNGNIGIQLNHKKDKWNSFVNADIAQRGRIRDANFYREVEQNSGLLTIFNQDAIEYNVRKVPTIRFGTDYDVNDSHSIGMMFNFYGQDAYNDFKFESDLNQGGEEFQIISENYLQNQFYNAQANLHYNFKMDTLGTELTADFNYIQLINRGGADFMNSYYFEQADNPSEIERLETNNPTRFDIISGQVDFEKNIFRKTKLEAGLKMSSVISDNNLEFYQFGEFGRSLDASRSNHFIYTENIAAAYGSFSGAVGAKLSYKVGLRAEQTFSEGRSLTLNTVNPRDYFDLFPSFFLQHRVSSNYQVNYNYSRRIDRPNYDNLNPFIFYLDPYTSAQGNPYLTPQYTHSISLTQTFLQKFNLVLNYGITTDFIAEIPIQNPEDGTTIFQQSNIDDQLNYSATAIVPYEPFKWWNINANLTVFHQEFSTFLNNERAERQATTGMLQLGNTFMLSKDYRVELNGDYRSNTVWGLYSIGAQWGLDFAIKKSFYNKKLEASLNLNDIFRTRRFVGNADFQGNVNEINQYFGQQSIGFSLRYRFSKGEEFKARSRNTNLDELNRAGG